VVRNAALARRLGGVCWQRPLRRAWVQRDASGAFFIHSGIGLSDGGAWSFAASSVSVGGAGLLVTGSRSGFRPSYADDEGTPLRAGCYFSGAFCFCGGTARLLEYAALWSCDYHLRSTFCPAVSSLATRIGGGPRSRAIMAPHSRRAASSRARFASVAEITSQRGLP
jgi:hypothetical protein